MKANYIFTKLKLIYALGFVSILSTSVAQATSFNTAFEMNQGYTVGPLNRQNGWFATPNVNVENTVSEQGNQAVKIGLTAGSFDDQYGNAPLPYPIPITNRFTSVSFFFLTNNTSHHTQAGMNVIGANGSSTPTTEAQIFIVGTGNPNSTFSYFGLGNFNSNTPLVLLANNVWHKCILDIDFQNNTVTGQIDGNVNLGMLTIIPATVITGVQMYNITDGITATSDAFFDKISISYNTGPVITP